MVTKSNKIIKEKEIVVDIDVNAITGINNYLYDRLKESFKRANSIDIIVSFLMESGVKMILEDLEEAINKGVNIRILTGNYLNITQPSALYLIKSKLKNKVELRFYNVKNKSFHPKAYMFHNELDSEIYIGSSNISRGALTTSVEWNYKFKKSSSKEDFNTFYNEFENLFYNYSIEVTDEVLENYSKLWVRPQVFRDWDKLKKEENIIPIYNPKGAQIEALYALNNSREEGFDKGIVVAATGIGKTYLAAFDSKEYKKVLFIAHREEIIKQAAESFKKVRDSDDIGFFYGNTKEINNSMIFALVQTLGKEEYLNENYFKKDYFDYIVVDEFHHAVSNNYKKIIDYFEPKFLLGLTATPERLDSKDVFEICDYNMVYEVRLKEAINKGWLVPFRYYGIYDETVNYENVSFSNGKYDSKELENELMINKRAELILKNYLKYNSRTAIGFCTSRGHAEYMAKYFKDNQIEALAVYSGEQGEFSANREVALNSLRNGETKVIFSVDMFNEGLDVPSIDLVMFLRPTESPTVFLQQLGRGLRKFNGKRYLNVLDFIGNYKRANLIPFLLSEKKYDSIKSKKGEFKEEDYPEDCIVNFDFKLIDIFKKQAEKEMKFEEKIREEYYRIKEEVKKIPSRLDILTLMDSDIYDAMKSKSNKNILRSYLTYLHDNNETNENEEILYKSRAKEFLEMIETTSMSKTYKMPVLLAFYNNGNIKMKVNEDDIYESFERFYNYKSNGIDLLRDKVTNDYKNWGKKEYLRLAKKNPIKFLLKTHGDFFKEEEGYVLALADDIEEFIKNEEFKKHFKDSIDYRVKSYYRDRLKNREKHYL